MAEESSEQRPIISKARIDEIRGTGLDQQIKLFIDQVPLIRAGIRDIPPKLTLKLRELYKEDPEGRGYLKAQSVEVGETVYVNISDLQRRMENH